MNKHIVLLLIFTNCISVKSQFKGGVGDGYAGIPTYSQPFTSVFSGGQNDGFAIASYSQAGAPLTINLINFTGKKIGDINQLNWQTSSEINASHFEIERSTDAKAFEKIGKIKADKSEIYSFIDHSSLIVLSSSLFYRLKLIDLDGKFSYSKIISIANDTDNELVGQFYPNPAVDEKTTIEIKTQEKEEWNISHFDLAGRLLKTETKIFEKGLNRFSVNNLPTGESIFQFQHSNKVVVRKVLK